jgi:hypothetical protein
VFEWQAHTAILKGQCQKAAEFSRLEMAAVEREKDEGRQRARLMQSSFISGATPTLTHPF